MQNENFFQNKNGFTLTELIIVMVIIAILAVVITPNLMGYVEKANDTADEVSARSLYVSAAAISTEYNAKGALAYVRPTSSEPIGYWKTGKDASSMTRDTQVDAYWAELVEGLPGYIRVIAFGNDDRYPNHVLWSRKNILAVNAEAEDLIVWTPYGIDEQMEEWYLAGWPGPDMNPVPPSTYVWPS